jgi:hypothetical protein
MSIAKGRLEQSRSNAGTSIAGTGIAASQPLLLTGDEFHVSNDGIARSLYEIDGSYSIAIEELYDLKHNKKNFVVRQQIGSQLSSEKGIDVLSRNARGVVPLGRCLAAVEIQEIEEHDLFLGEAGTGSTTWESSIAMALFFHENPEALFGNVVEVGCGVGLGGILNAWTKYSSPFMSSLGGSITLTDGNDKVLTQCQENLVSNYSLFQYNYHDISTKKLEWHEYPGKYNSMRASFDTVVGCDCAYRYKDIDALSETMSDLLAPGGTIHFFAPYNRSTLYDLIRVLKDGLGLNVLLDWIDLNRYRLKPGCRSKLPSEAISFDDCLYASKATAKILHIIASKKTESGRIANSDTRDMHAID